MLVLTITPAHDICGIRTTRILWSGLAVWLAVMIAMMRYSFRKRQDALKQSCGQRRLLMTLDSVFPNRRVASAVTTAALCWLHSDKSGPRLKRKLPVSP